MYSILALGVFMTCEAFGIHLPEWLSPLATFVIVGFFFLKSATAAGGAGGAPKPVAALKEGGRSDTIK